MLHLYNIYQSEYKIDKNYLLQSGIEQIYHERRFYIASGP